MAVLSETAATMKKQITGKSNKQNKLRVNHAITTIRELKKWARQWKRPSFNISEVYASSYYDFIVYNLTRVFVNRMF